MLVRALYCWRMMLGIGSYGWCSPRLLGHGDLVGNISTGLFMKLSSGNASNDDRLSGADLDDSADLLLLIVLNVRLEKAPEDGAVNGTLADTDERPAALLSLRAPVVSSGVMVGVVGLMLGNVGVISLGRLQSKSGE